MSGKLTLTKTQLRDLQKFAAGGSLPQERFFALCDAGACDYTKVMRVEGTLLTATEHVTITKAGRAALSTATQGSGEQ